MSSFFCEHCGAPILDSDRGYETGCNHYPLENRTRVHVEPLPHEPRVEPGMDQDEGES